MNDYLPSYTGNAQDAIAVAEFIIDEYREVARECCEEHDVAPNVMFNFEDRDRTTLWVRSESTGFYRFKSMFYPRNLLVARPYEIQTHWELFSSWRSVFFEYTARS